MGPTGRERRVGSSPKPITFDAGALIAIERGDPAVRALARVLATSNTLILVPAPAVAEVWRGETGRQARLAQFLRTGLEHGHIEIIALDLPVAKEVGVILGRVSMSIADAAVCRCAVLTRGTVVTSDPDDIQKIIPSARITVV